MVGVSAGKHPLPDGWRWAKLGEVCQQETGTRDPQMEPDIQFQYVDITAIDNRAKRIVAAKTLLGKDAPSRARRVILAGDVIVSTTRPNLNAVALVPPELDHQVCSTGFCVLRANGSLSPAYLFTFVQSRQFIRGLSDLVTGALYPAVTDGQVHAQFIPLPPLLEQKRIAALLAEEMAAVERARVASEARLEAAKALPAAYLRQVFESEEAKSWPRKRLGEVCRVVSGSTPSTHVPHYWDGDIVWVTPTDLGKLENELILTSARKITEAGYESCGTELVPLSSVVLSSRAPIGHLGIACVPLCTNQGCKSFVPSSEVDSQFLYFALKISVPDLQALGSGATFTEVSKTALENFLIPLPPLAEQRRISAHLSERMAAVEDVRKASEEQWDAINKLPAALLRRAFNG